jgi:hypothetical protein
MQASGSGESEKQASGSGESEKQAIGSGESEKPANGSGESEKQFSGSDESEKQAIGSDESEKQASGSVGDSCLSDFTLRTGCITKPADLVYIEKQACTKPKFQCERCLVPTPGLGYSVLCDNPGTQSRMQRAP